MTAIPCMLIRGGTSRGAYFHRADLPTDDEARNALLLRIMGGPDPLQVNGVGGGHPLTSKVAVVQPSQNPKADVDFLFLQIDPIAQTVSDVQNCGNILAGVGLFAIAQGLVPAQDPTTTVRVFMSNTGAMCHLDMQTPGGAVETEGDTAIDGVPGTAAPIVCNYLDIAGSACGALLPTGNAVDEIDGVALTCVDNGMPVVVMRAADLGVAGTESPAMLDDNDDLKSRLESIRLQLGPMMNLGDVREKSVPKMCLVSPPQNGGLVMTRTFIPHVCHKTIGVLGAVSAATACLTPGTPAAEVAEAPEGNGGAFDVEHPGGSLRVQLDMDADGTVRKAGIVRTGRVIFEGKAHA